MVYLTFSFHSFVWVFFLSFGVADQNIFDAPKLQLPCSSNRKYLRFNSYPILALASLQLPTKKWRTYSHECSLLVWFFFVWGEMRLGSRLLVLSSLNTPRGQCSAIVSDFLSHHPSLVRKPLNVSLHVGYWIQYAVRVLA